jgi:predicted ABC-class ATPase
MALDDETRRELEELRNEIADLRRSRATSRPDTTGLGQTLARADLDEVLRENGYRLNRRELDDLVKSRDDAALESKLEALLTAREAAAAAAEEEEEEEEELDENGKPKPKPAAKKPAAKKTPAPEDDEEAEWK